MAGIPSQQGWRTSMMDFLRRRKPSCAPATESETDERAAAPSGAPRTRSPFLKSSVEPIFFWMLAAHDPASRQSCACDGWF